MGWKMATDFRVALAVHRIRAISCEEKVRLASNLGSIQSFEKLSLGDLEQCIRRRTQIRVWEPEVWARQAERDEKSLTMGDFTCNFYTDRNYPPLLREIHDPPYLLFCRGALPKEDLPALAIVGTRYPTGSGKKAAFQLGFEAGVAGIPVVSGLARGIDTAAHLGNAEGGGKTVAVLGCGIDRMYPASGFKVARRILETGGCIISEYGTGILPLKYHFPERNRIISGICRATVVVEAPEKSGALITADFALEQGRDLFVHNRCLEGKGNLGCRRLHYDGAEPVDGCADIVSSWGYGSVAVPPVKADGPASEADLLRRELRGELITHAGEYYTKRHG